MGTILEYGQLANAVYDDVDSIAGWTRKAFKPTGSGLNDSLQAAAYTKNGETAFVFKGTDNKRDVVADIKLGIGMNTVQYSQARQFVQKVGLSDAGLVTIIGHSLGGAIAQTVGNRLRQRFVTFNAPGVAVLASRNVDEFAVAGATGSGYVRVAGMIASAFMHPMQAARDVGSAFYKVSGVNIRLGKDVVGCIGVHYGKVIEINYSGSALDVMAKHKMGTMLKSLEENRQIDVGHEIGP